MRILFLDHDGVLNRHQRNPDTHYCSIDRDLAENLNYIIRSVPDLKIVITSAWRYMVHSGSMNLQGYKNLLYSHWINAEGVIDITRQDICETHMDRGLQITEYLDKMYLEHIIESYLVIDDMDLDITKYKHPFIQTESLVGLTKDQANLAIQHLLNRND